MLPKPIRPQDDPQLERMVAALTRKGKTPDRAREEATQTLAAQREAEAELVIEDLTDGFGPCF